MTAVASAGGGDALPTMRSGRSRSATLAVATLSAMAVAAGGALAWEALSQPHGVAAPTVPVSASSPLPDANSPAAQPPALTATALAPEPTHSAAVEDRRLPPFAARPASPAEPRAERTAAAPEAAAGISPAADPPRVSDDVRLGYDALRRGDFAMARSRYEAAVAADPDNTDARLGLATACAAAGDREDAARHYREALAQEPGNAAAVAGLAALRESSRAEGVESMLRARLAQHPDSAALHDALGSLYADQGRWTEAQAAHFEAHRIDPDNPETIYNLAVSLDHLGEARLARDFYGHALSAARGRDVPFDVSEVTRRIAQLGASR